MNAIIGEKLGMTQIFDEENRSVPVTAVKAGPVVVTQIKRVKTLTGTQPSRSPSRRCPPARPDALRPDTFGKAGVPRIATSSKSGSTILIPTSLASRSPSPTSSQEGAKADVTGISKGKGFAG